MNFINRQKVVIIFWLVIFLFSCSQKNNDINLNTSYNANSYFIIDNNVKIYSDKNSSEIIMTCNFFEPVTLLSKEIINGGKICIQLTNGKIGWVEEHNTSVIPENWQRLAFDDLFYCYMFSDEKIIFQEQQSRSHKVYSFKNNQFEVVMGIVYTNNYQKDFNNKKDDINQELQGGADKNFNWNKEFTYGDYKINYIITTNHPDGYISESFDFIKINEMNLDKYYFVSVDYNPLISKEKKLIYRKILFSLFKGFNGV